MKELTAEEQSALWHATIRLIIKKLKSRDKPTLEEKAEPSVLRYGAE